MKKQLTCRGLDRLFSTNAMDSIGKRKRSCSSCAEALRSYAYRRNGKATDRELEIKTLDNASGVQTATITVQLNWLQF